MMNPTRTIDDVCLQIVDCEHKTAPIDPVGDYFAVGTPAMRGNSINYAESRRISKDTFDKWTRRLAPETGDLLFAREAPVGPIVRIPETGNVAPGQRTMLLRPNPTLVNSNFLYYLLTSPMQQERLLSRVTGSTVAHLNVADVRAFQLPTLPSVDQQRAIADVLEALDNKITANAKLVEVADKLATSLTRQAMDLSASVVLSSIAHIVMGSSPLGASFNESGEGIVFYQGVRDFGIRFPSNRVWTTAPARLAVAGDTLLSVRAPVGRVNLATEDTCIGRGVASIRSSNYRPFTLFHLLKDSHEAWAPFEAEGTVFGSINKGQLASLQVPGLLPDHADRLEGALAPIELAIASALTENAVLAATRDALLPQLMSGKLRVADAEKVLEDAGV
jgi:type I restriction enzyme S subunit